MKYDKLVKRVSEVAELGSREEAKRAIKATFETLRACFVELKVEKSL